jgi:CD109 antigen
MLFDVTYNTRHIEADNLVDVNVQIAYTGVKTKTGMIIADVGVPTGFEVVRGLLDDLVNAKIVQRVEVAGRKVIFYVDSLVPGKLLSFAFQIRALYPVKAQATVSRAYEYYDASVEAYHQDTPLTFGPARSRVRP